jgi:hypothetical protein
MIGGIISGTRAGKALSAISGVGMRTGRHPIMVIRQPMTVLNKFRCRTAMIRSRSVRHVMSGFMGYMAVSGDTGSMKADWNSGTQ